jgi:hypothetical protein
LSAIFTSDPYFEHTAVDVIHPISITIPSAQLVSPSTHLATKFALAFPLLNSMAKSITQYQNPENPKTGCKVTTGL